MHAENKARRIVLGATAAFVLCSVPFSRVLYDNHIGQFASHAPVFKVAEPEPSAQPPLTSMKRQAAQNQSRFSPGSTIIVPISAHSLEIIQLRRTHP